MGKKSRGPQSVSVLAGCRKGDAAQKGKAAKGTTENEKIAMQKSSGVGGKTRKVAKGFNRCEKQGRTPGRGGIGLYRSAITSGCHDFVRSS